MSTWEGWKTSGLVPIRQKGTRNITFLLYHTFIRRKGHNILINNFKEDLDYVAFAEHAQESRMYIHENGWSFDFIFITVILLSFTFHLTLWTPLTDFKGFCESGA